MRAFTTCCTAALLVAASAAAPPLVGGETGQAPPSSSTTTELDPVEVFHEAEQIRVMADRPAAHFEGLRGHELNEAHLEAKAYADALHREYLAAATLLEPSPDRDLRIARCYRQLGEIAELHKFARQAKLRNAQDSWAGMEMEHAEIYGLFFLGRTPYADLADAAAHIALERYEHARIADCSTVMAGAVAAEQTARVIMKHTGGHWGEAPSLLEQAKAVREQHSVEYDPEAITSHYFMISAPEQKEES